MTAAPFQAAAARDPIDILIGEPLRANEPPASLAGISPAMRRALTAFHMGRLDCRGSLGWHPPGRSLLTPIRSITIRKLSAEGLAAIVSRTPLQRHARITARGEWFARTLTSKHKGHCG